MLWKWRLSFANRCSMRISRPAGEIGRRKTANISRSGVVNGPGTGNCGGLSWPKRNALSGLAPRRNVHGLRDSVPRKSTVLDCSTKRKRATGGVRRHVPAQPRAAIHKCRRGAKGNDPDGFVGVLERGERWRSAGTGTGAGASVKPKRFSGQEIKTEGGRPSEALGNWRNGSPN
jgi:hypothetical protein